MCPKASKELTKFLPDCVVHGVGELREALKLLVTENYELLVIGVLFDDFRMFDLLKRVLENP